MYTATTSIRVRTEDGTPKNVSLRYQKVIEATKPHTSVPTPATSLLFSNENDQV